MNNTQNIQPIRRALISVYDKKNILPFAKKLQEYGVEILSTGGTAKLLKKNRIRVTEIQDYTKMPELMDGRVKTLHPKIHGGILALRNKKNHLQQAGKNHIPMIDLVVVNLYPFSETLQNERAKPEEIIEMIDIGGPAMLRSAAKNFAFVTALFDPRDYENVLREIKEFGGTTLETRKKLAAKVFFQTQRYDFEIANYLHDLSGGKELLDLHYEKVINLRYGENPHQKAIFFKNPFNRENNISNAKILHGKQLSFNNILDCDAATELVREFNQPAAVFVKHTNPCGVATGRDISEVFKKACEVDPKSAFGCVIALNRVLTGKIADYIERKKIFVEVIAAPSLETVALKKLCSRKNLRILSLGPLKKAKKRRDIKKVAGGVLVQTADLSEITAKNLRVVTRKRPSKNQIDDLLFAAKVVKHVKSNAVVFAKNLVTVAVGAGQMSRVDSVTIAKIKGGRNLKGSVMASDAFFPFEDAVSETYKAGAVAIIQPGGSVRDKEIIQKADELGISMVFSGVRNFRH